MRLEELTPGVKVRGVVPRVPVTVIQVRWLTADAIELTYKQPEGQVAQVLVYRDQEGDLVSADEEQDFDFRGDGHLMRLVSEAHRLQLAHLFDPLLAVHTSDVEPLPHQITAVYEAMLPRQPLRFLLADDPGAGKTIMAGLLIKELIARGDLQRCLVVCPAGLADQWQDELVRRFQLSFQILTNEALKTAPSGNWFAENNLIIGRLDKLARDENVQKLLQAPECDFDLIVCDEAHKMSATYSGSEIKYTKRYRLGQLLSGLTRHFLLMTATPHNGKERDFQLFMSLIDRDRFEGRWRSETQRTDVSDLMRRMVKERLRTFDNEPLFPPRVATTVPYPLSPMERGLYEKVTAYVTQEFNRADKLDDRKRGNAVGFALTLLQRRLASSPAAIHESLRRREERLRDRLSEVEAGARSAHPGSLGEDRNADSDFDEEYLEDLDDLPESERQEVEGDVLDAATAARSAAELRAEIRTLARLKERAAAVRRSRSDTKWRELAELLGGLFVTPRMERVAERRLPYGSNGNGVPDRDPKLVIFTEHLDTLHYLEDRIGTLLGRPEAVAVIHGSVPHPERLKVQEAFRHDPAVQVLLATDAAGEGINLQCAHLMVNYDLPWNPNRLEQRFGRIHRIGQTEECHLWNLVAQKTREGDVYNLLLSKLEEARKSLGGQVFDVLGKLQFGGRSLRDLLVQAIRSGTHLDVSSNLKQVVDNALDPDEIQNLLEERALVQNVMDTTRLMKIRAEMQEAELRRLQPHHVRAFFMEGFNRLGGAIYPREAGRYEIRRVPPSLLSGTGPMSPAYERVAFDKNLLRVHGKPTAAFLCPGHALVDAVIAETLQRWGHLMLRGAVLVDERDHGSEPRVLYYIEHEIRDGTTTASGKQRVISKRMLYVEIDRHGTTIDLQYSPYLDYRPLDENDGGLDEILSQPECMEVRKGGHERVVQHAVEHAVPLLFVDIVPRRRELIARTEEQVKERLTREISYWDRRAVKLREQERAGKTTMRLSAGEAARRAKKLQERLRARMDELKLEAGMTAGTPVIRGAVLVVPGGLLRRTKGEPTLVDPNLDTVKDTMETAKRAREEVLQVERELGFEGADREHEKVGYDILSEHPESGECRFIEVKGRAAGAPDITVTRNEIIYALNHPDAYILAIVIFDDPKEPDVHYVRRPFTRRPDFNEVDRRYKLDELLKLSTKPC